MTDRPRFRSLGLVLGLLFLAGALVWLAEEIWFGSRAQSTRAVVVKHVRVRRGYGRAVVEFEGPGRVVQATAKTLFYFDPSPGQVVPVLYQPNDPADARIDTFEQRYLMVLIIHGVAVVWNGGNIFAWIRRRASVQSSASVEA